MQCGDLHKSLTIVNKIKLRSFRIDNGGKNSTWTSVNWTIKYCLSYVRFTLFLRIIHILELFTLFTDL